MNTAVEKHPLELEKERFSIKKPDARLSNVPGSLS